MGRTRSPEVTKRNEVIYAEWRRGASLTSLGEQYGLARQVVGRIVAAQHPEEAEDYDRSLYRGYLWRLFEEIRELYRNPGFKMSPTGKPAEDPFGDPAEDTNVKLQAGELELKILESLRKMDARDRPVLQRHSHEFYENQAAADIARRRAEVELSSSDRDELETLRRQLKVVRGEVAAELPPAQESA